MSVHISGFMVGLSVGTIGTGRGMVEATRLGSLFDCPISGFRSQILVLRLVPTFLKGL